MIVVLYGAFAMVLLCWLLVVLDFRGEQHTVKPGRPGYKKIERLEIELAVRPPPEGYVEHVVIEDGIPTTYWTKPRPADQVLKEMWAGNPGSWRGEETKRIPSGRYKTPPPHWLLDYYRSLDRIRRKAS